MCRCSGQDGVRDWRTRNFLLEESKECIAAAGVLRLWWDLPPGGLLAGGGMPSHHRRAVAEACGLDIIATEGSAPQFGGQRLPQLPSGDPYSDEGLVSSLHEIDPSRCP